MTTIRKCLAGDEAAVLNLARDFATSFKVEAPVFSAGFSEVLASPAMHLAVAQSEDAVIGYVLGIAHPTFYAGGHVAWVEEIMVREDFRRGGVGKLLMENFENWAASKNCRLVALATRRAADFYKSLGYAESATYFRKVMKSDSNS